jgi:hypothetical protein
VLFARAAALRTAMGAPIRPADRPALNRALAAGRTSLGEDHFGSAWAAGESLPMEKIVARAGDDQ